jgi:hypothetical protein
VSTFCWPRRRRRFPGGPRSRPNSPAREGSGPSEEVRRSGTGPRGRRLRLHTRVLQRRCLLARRRLLPRCRLRPPRCLLPRLRWRPHPRLRPRRRLRPRLRLLPRRRLLPSRCLCPHLRLPLRRRLLPRRRLGGYRHGIGRSPNREGGRASRRCLSNDRRPGRQDAGCQSCVPGCSRRQILKRLRPAGPQLVQRERGQSAAHPARRGVPAAAGSFGQCRELRLVACARVRPSPADLEEL